MDANDIFGEQQMAYLSQLADGLLSMELPDEFGDAEYRRHVYDLTEKIHGGEVPYETVGGGRLKEIAQENRVDVADGEQLLGFGTRKTAYVSEDVPASLLPYVLRHEIQVEGERINYADSNEELLAEIAGIQADAVHARIGSGKVKKNAQKSLYGALALAAYSSDELSTNIRRAAFRSATAPSFDCALPPYATGGARKLKDDSDLEWSTGKLIDLVAYPFKFAEENARKFWNDVSGNWFGEYFEVGKDATLTGSAAEAVNRLCGSMYGIAENAGKSEKPAEPKKTDAPKEPKKEEKKEK